MFLGWRVRTEDWASAVPVLVVDVVVLLEPLLNLKVEVVQRLTKHPPTKKEQTTFGRLLVQTRVWTVMFTS